MRRDGEGAFISRISNRSRGGSGDARTDEGPSYPRDQDHSILSESTNSSSSAKALLRGAATLPGAPGPLTYTNSRRPDEDGAYNKDNPREAIRGFLVVSDKINEKEAVTSHNVLDNAVGSHAHGASSPVLASPPSASALAPFPGKHVPKPPPVSIPQPTYPAYAMNSPVVTGGPPTEQGPRTARGSPGNGRPPSPPFKSSPSSNAAAHNPYSMTSRPTTTTAPVSIPKIHTFDPSKFMKSDQGSPVAVPASAPALQEGLVDQVIMGEHVSSPDSSRLSRSRSSSDEDYSTSTGSSSFISSPSFVSSAATSASVSPSSPTRRYRRSGARPLLSPDSNSTAPTTANASVFTSPGNKPVSTLPFEPAANSRGNSGAEVSQRSQWTGLRGKAAVTTDGDNRSDIHSETSTAEAIDANFIQHNAAKQTHAPVATGAGALVADSGSEAVDPETLVFPDVTTLRASSSVQAFQHAMSGSASLAKGPPPSSLTAGVSNGNLYANPMSRGSAVLRPVYAPPPLPGDAPPPAVDDLDNDETEEPLEPKPVRGLSGLAMSAVSFLSTTAARTPTAEQNRANSNWGSPDSGPTKMSSQAANGSPPRGLTRVDQKASDSWTGQSRSVALPKKHGVSMTSHIARASTPATIFLAVLRGLNRLLSLGILFTALGLAFLLLWGLKSSSQKHLLLQRLQQLQGHSDTSYGHPLGQGWQQAILTWAQARITAAASFLSEELQWFQQTLGAK